MTRRVWVASSLLAMLLASAPARAGPVEARARWREAMRKKSAPWRDRLLAFREVRRAAPPHDPIRARALAGEARALRDGGRPEGAAAAEAEAASLGPRREPDRLACVMVAARELLDDGDRRGALPYLLEVAEEGGKGAPWMTAPALDLLSRLAADSSDAEELERIERQAATRIPRAVGLRLRLLDRIGCLSLDLGDVVRARRAHDLQRRLFADALRARESLAREASDAWVDLRLPKRLAG
jgi:hypothetical protein